jgi:fumarylpyruvate hydrolase
MSDYAVPMSLPVTLPVVESNALFPVHHVYAVTGNYGDQPQLAAVPGTVDPRPRPAIFTKAPDSVLPSGSTAPYPPATEQLEPEVEMVVALGKGGRELAIEAARDVIFGYAVGFDMTRRDLQSAARQEGKPWDIAKWFDGATPISDINPVGAISHPVEGAITLEVNDARVQEGDLNQMIWKPAEVVSIVSKFFTLHPGDLIFTGTPAGETIVGHGDRLDGRIEGVGHLSLTIE